MKRLFTLLIFISFCHAGSAQWINLDSIPEPRASSTSFAIGDTGYVVAGGGSCGCYLNTGYAYSRSSNTWSPIATYPSGYDDGPVAFAIGDTGYVGSGATGGYQFSSSFFKYDPHTNTWTPIANIPGSGFGSGVAFVINGKGYVGGGFGGYYVPSNAFYVYDPATGQWSTIAPCPAKGVSVNAVAFSLNGKGYVGTGGYMANGSNSWPPQSDFWSYDPATDHWDSIAPFPGPRMGGFAFAACNTAYVGGGVSDANQQIVHADVWQYDPSVGPLGTWKLVPDFAGYGRFRATAFVIGKNGYVCGGNFSPSGADLWEHTYTPAFYTPNTSVCSQQPVTFTDTSNYTPTNWQWSFPGATPNTSSQQNPTVQYDSAGTYDVTLTAWNGCDSGTYTATNYITVGAGGTLTATANPTSVCYGQPSVLTVASASGSYAWQPAAGLQDSTSASITVNPTITTTYTVSQPNGNCPSVGQVTVSVANNTLGGSITATRDTICSGTSGNLLLSGNSSDSIVWQSSLTNTGGYTPVGPVDTTKYRTDPLLQSTWFRAIVGKGACQAASDSLHLVVPPTLTASFTSITTGKTISFNSGGSIGNINNYFWDFGDGTTSNDSNPVHTYAKDTIYNPCLTIYDGSNCSYTFCRSVILGVPTISADGSWLIYPNPFGNELNIDTKTFNNHVQSIEMFDVLGRVMISETTGNIDNAAFALNTSALAKGMYYLMIKTTDADYVQKVVKQ